MATSETMSAPNESLQFYQTNYFSGIDQIPPPPTAAGSSNSSLTPNQGRVSKPLRRRARASRRAPTALFNTDTANFRSIVQRFTGAPISPFAARSRPPGGGETFVRDAMNELATAVNDPPAAGFHMQYTHPQHQQVFMSTRMQGGGDDVVSSHAPPGFSSTEDPRDFYRYSYMM